MINLKFNNNSQPGKVFQELNIEFYKQLQEWIIEEDVTFYGKLTQKTKLIKQQLQQFTSDEQAEWSYHIGIKIRQLASSSTNQTTEELLEKLFMLVDCANRFTSNIYANMQVPYEYEKVHILIKQTYYEIYKEKIVSLLKKTGFDVQEFQVFQYQDPWYTKMWRAVFQ